MNLQRPLSYLAAPEGTKGQLYLNRETPEKETDFVHVDIGGEDLANHVERLAPLKGIRITGKVTPEGVAVLKSLPSLRYLELSRTPSIDNEILSSLEGFTLHSLRLRVVPVNFLASLKGVRVEHLSLFLRPGEDDVAPMVWESLGEMGLQSLHIKGENVSMPPSAAEMLAKSGMHSLVSELSPFSEESLAALLSGGLKNVGVIGPESVRVEGNASLERFELGNSKQVELVDLPSLRVFDANHATQIHLKNLPSLRLVPVKGHTTLENLSGLEAIVKNGWQAVESLVVKDVPSLRRVVFDESDASEAHAAAAATGADVVVIPTKAARAKTGAPKRKVHASKRPYPALGWDAVPSAVVMVGKRSRHILSEKVAKALGTVGAFWSLETQHHIAAVPPMDASGGTHVPVGEPDGEGVADLVVGRVVGLARDGESFTLAKSSMEEALASGMPEDFWEEINGVAKKEVFTGELEVFLLAAGADCQARLSAEDTPDEFLCRVDDQVVPLAVLDVTTLPDSMVLKQAPSGLRWQNQWGQS